MVVIILSLTKVVQHIEVVALIWVVSREVMLSSLFTKTLTVRYGRTLLALSVTMIHRGLTITPIA